MTAEAPRFRSGYRDDVEELWRRQWLVATSAQLQRRGWTRQAIASAVAARRLFVVHRGDYALVPADLLSAEGRRAAAILRGGRGAALCDATALALLGLTRRAAPVAIDVAVAGPRRPVDGITWHELTLRPGDVVRHAGFPVTSPARTILDRAVHAPLEELLLALAEAEFRFGLDATAIAATARQGHPGSAALRAAAARHTPQLARTRSELELAFVHLLRRHGLKLPEVNHPAGRATVDALWRDERVAAELDGVRGHSGERRVLRDHRRDLHRRADRLTVLRYHFTQIVDEPALVVADLRRAGVPTAG